MKGEWWRRIRKCTGREGGMVGMILRYIPAFSILFLRFPGLRMLTFT